MNYKARQRSGRPYERALGPFDGLTLKAPEYKKYAVSLILAVVFDQE